MARPHWNKRSGAGGNTNQVARSEPDQGGLSDRVRLGPTRYDAQKRLDAWKAGTEALEAKMAKHRAVHHKFVPMGTLPACEKCGMTRADRRDDGALIHYSRE